MFASKVNFNLLLKVFLTFYNHKLMLLIKYSDKKSTLGCVRCLHAVSTILLGIFHIEIQVINTFRFNETLSKLLLLRHKILK
jgi:hypothetical protein